MSISSPHDALNSEQVARDFRARLLRFIRARVSSAADAEDITQDVLLRMHRSVSTLAAGERLGAWLFQVARNAIVDYYRARGRASEVVDPHTSTDIVAEEFAGSPDEDPKRFERDASRCLDAFIDRLDARYAEALRLVDVEGLTHKAVADRVGLSVPGVKSRVQRARASLKKTLSECCMFDFGHADGLVEFRENPEHRACSVSCGSQCASTAEKPAP